MLSHNYHNIFPLHFITEPIVCREGDCKECNWHDWYYLQNGNVEREKRKKNVWEMECCRSSLRLILWPTSWTERFNVEDRHLSWMDVERKLAIKLWNVCVLSKANWLELLLFIRKPILICLHYLLFISFGLKYNG